MRLKWPFLVLLCCVPSFVFAQFDKANKLFQDKRYAAAIPLFEEGLKEKNHLVAKSRLAYCYRMLNQTDKAELLYSEVVAHDKARSETYFYYAESLMNNGKYAEAKQWFQKYHTLQPEDSLALQRAAACDYVPSIQPYFHGLHVEAFDQNSESDDNSPVFWRGGIVFTSDRPSGTALLKQKSGWTGRDYLKLWYSRYDAQTGLFKNPELFSYRLNNLNKNTANASFTGDWNTIFFSRNGNTSNRKNDVTLQLYTAERSNGRWKNEHKLEFCNIEQNYMHPAISADGKLLFYATTGGSRGGFDIFMAQKNRDGEWGLAKNLGPVVNTTAHEAFPYYHHDGRLFFCSKGHAGYGGFDIFVTRFDSATGQWTAPTNLGRPVNSPLDDIGFYLAPNDSAGCFSSARLGGDDNMFLLWLGATKNFQKVLGIGDEILEQPAAETLNAAIEMPITPEKVPRPIEYAATSPADTTVAMATPLATLSELVEDVSLSRLQIGKIYLLDGIYFDSLSRTALSPTADPEIGLLASLLEQNALLKLEIAGHTSSQGKTKANLAISRAQAVSVMAALVGRGIAADRLTAIGYGEKQLRNNCKDGADCSPEKHAENNRIEIKVVAF